MRDVYQFQSLIGRLQTTQVTNTHHTEKEFQSLIGRLQTKQLKNTKGSHINSFNPSQVGYRLQKPTKKPKKEEGFNPSQVGYRLGQKGQISFQFHEFQSLIGRLQTNSPVCGAFFISRFNPSQVGYRHGRLDQDEIDRFSFNPSQVGYRLIR